MNSRVLGSLVVLAAVAVVPAQAALTTDPAQSGYDAAVGLTRARSYEQAEFAWLNFLRQYPSSPLDGNAQYFLGETYYGRNDYRHAAAAYAAGIEKYPRGDMASETLLKLGISLGRSGDLASACEAFGRLDRDFPGAAGVVRERSLVEKRQYHCADTPAQASPAVADAAAPPSAIPATAAGPDASPPSAPAAPAAARALMPEPAKLASLEPRTFDGEPAPPAVPTIPVERKKLSEIDAERAAARAELTVPAFPVTGKSSRRPAITASAASTDSIKTAQNLLIALNYDVGPADGQAGPKLRDAISAFETKSGMRSDGEVSDQLLQHLSAALTVRKKPAPEVPQPRIVGAGTGFVVSKSGFVMTSYRLVEQCGEIRVRTPGSEGAATPLVASDPHNDLALLHLPSPAATAVTFREGRGPRQGDGVVVTGLSSGPTDASEFYLTSAVISALSGAKNDSGVLKLSVPASASEHGSAPVFDRTGEVIGILAGTAPTKGAANGTSPDGGVALRATIARNFLDVHDVDYESAQSATELKASEIGEQAKGAVVLVECRR